MTRLHSQYDFGKTSRDAKINGREAIRIHPRDAEARDIADSDIVRVFNDRGATLAGAVVTDRGIPSLALEAGGGLWERQMVLGPGAECCLLATEEIVVPRALETRVITVELAWLNA